MLQKTTNWLKTKFRDEHIHILDSVSAGFTLKYFMKDTLSQTSPGVWWIRLVMSTAWEDSVTKNCPEKLDKDFNMSTFLQYLQIRVRLSFVGRRRNTSDPHFWGPGRSWTVPQTWIWPGRRLLSSSPPSSSSRAVFSCWRRDHDPSGFPSRTSHHNETSFTRSQHTAPSTWVGSCCFKVKLKRVIQRNERFYLDGLTTFSF